MFTGTGVTITKEEPVISFKGTFFGEFSKLLAATDPRILGESAASSLDYGDYPLSITTSSLEHDDFTP